MYVDVCCISQVVIHKEYFQFQPLTVSCIIFITLDLPPCKTLNAALGNQSCDSCSVTNTTSVLSDVVFKLTSGVYHLQGCVGIVGATNVTIQSHDLTDDVIIECETFPNNVVGNYDNLYVCGSAGVTFRGVQFTRCGPQSPNIFLNSSSGVVFDNCTFT